MSLPIVAIVGRPNVGKSSLLNRLAKRKIAIVDAISGVTRDRISTPVEIGDGYIELVDTGGMGIEDHDDLTEHVEDQISYGLESASLIIFLVDARDGVMPLDSHVARRLRTQKKPVILVANKMDMARQISEVGELTKLGFGKPFLISATHNKGIPEVIDAISEKLHHLVEDAPAAKMKLAIVGKRNAGKSTFINALAGQQRVIVSEVPGTTRDSVDVEIEIDDRKFTLIDTAGLRKRSKVDGDIEYYSQHRAMRSIRRADVVAMFVDASVPISQIDKQLSREISDNFKPVVIVVNKWDLAKDKVDGEEYAEYFTKTLPELRYAPISLASALTGENLQQTVAVAEDLYSQACYRVPTPELNNHIKEILHLRGPSHKTGTKPPKILYATQIATLPPTIVCFVNDTRSFDENYRRFLINQLRDRLPFSEVPIQLMFRKRRKTTKHDQQELDQQELDQPELDQQELDQPE